MDGFSIRYYLLLGLLRWLSGFLFFVCLCVCVFGMAGASW